MTRPKQGFLVFLMFFLIQAEHKVFYPSNNCHHFHPQELSEQIQITKIPNSMHQEIFLSTQALSAP